jgi:RNA methyltransferase, TrmH family
MKRYGGRIGQAAGARAVSSLQNPTVKFIRSLQMRKARRESGLFVAEGASILITAREQGFVPVTLMLLHGSATSGVARELVEWAAASGAECVEVSAAVLAKIAAKDNPQTMLGVFRQRWAVPPDITKLGEGAVWLALEEIRDPGNLGTIIRTVDAVGGRGVVLVGPCCDPYSREAVRATMGSIFSVPLVGMARDSFLEWARPWPGDIAGTHLEAETDFRSASYREPVLLLMGSEGPGLSAPLASICTKLVKIPMAGRLDSLNLAVATALTLYRIRGRWLAVREQVTGGRGRE